MTEVNSQSYMNDMLNMSEDRDELIDEERDIETGASEVAEFFEGLNILVTGGSGFLGKLLVEKLLRSCPQMGKLYMLMRPKKGKVPLERFKEQFDDVVYDRLKREQPDFMKHVVMIEGDTGIKDLGLSTAVQEKLVETVNVIFHGAATVRFDESFHRAISTNVRGTETVVKFAKRLKNLKAFVHISTAFSQCVFKNIEEKFYDPPMDPKKALALIELLDDDILRLITSRILGAFPNTYTFSKALGEEIVRQNCREMPACIIRPSIMIATYKEPVPGWINNYYGATGVVAAVGTGLLRSLHCEPECIADIIPADFVINNIIVAAWDCAKKKKEKKIMAKDEIKQQTIEREDPIIYNAVSSCQKPIDWGSFMYFCAIFGKEVPSINFFWYYSLMLNRYAWVHDIYRIFVHTIPGAIGDFLAILTGHKPMMLKSYKKIHKFSGVISYFSSQQWKFDNKNVINLWKRTSPVDRKKFYFNLKQLDWVQNIRLYMRGIRQYIFKDDWNTVGVAIIRYRRLKIIHYTVVTAAWLLFLWGIFSVINSFMW